MDDNLYITSEKLDTLTNCVTMKNEFLKQMNRNDMWNRPVEYCKKIEKSVMAVHTVVLEAQNVKGHFMSSSAYPLNSEMMIIRVYILLYYYHRDDALYNAVVFPALKEHVRAFHGKQLDAINSQLNEIIKLEELIKKAEQESRKNLQPKFQLTLISKGMSDELYDEYNEEKLFRSLTAAVETLGRKYYQTLDVAEVWYNAKQIIKKLWQVNYPEQYIKRILDAQNKQLGASDSLEPQVVMMCVYAMMRSVKKSDHFKRAVSELDDYANPYHSADFSVLNENMRAWKGFFDDKNVFDGYDYVGEEPHKDTFTAADIIRLQENFQKQLNEKDEEIERLKQQQHDDDMSDHDSDAVEDKDNKPRLALLLKLMEKDGLDLNKKGIKKKTVAELMEYLSGIPLKSCQNFCSDPHVDSDHHKETITKVNGQLQSVNMEIRL